MSTTRFPAKLRQFWNKVKQAPVTVSRKIQSGFAALGSVIRRGWDRFANWDPSLFWMVPFTAGTINAIYAVRGIALLASGLASPLAPVVLSMFTFGAIGMYAMAYHCYRVEYPIVSQPPVSSTAAQVSRRLGDGREVPLHQLQASVANQPRIGYFNPVRPAPVNPPEHSRHIVNGILPRM